MQLFLANLTLMELLSPDLQGLMGVSCFLHPPGLQRLIPVPWFSVSWGTICLQPQAKVL